MKILKNGKEFAKEIKRLIQAGPDYIYISSFGLKVDTLMEFMLAKAPRKCKIKILIGVTPRTKKRQIEFYKSYFKDFEVRVVHKNHMKLFLTNSGGIVGGRNLTGGDWDDLDITIDNTGHIKQLKSYFESVYNRKKPL